MSGGKINRPALVLAALKQAEKPLSAYDLLDLLRDQGFRAPLQVYRALEKLQEQGAVHRLETLNAFMACDHEGCQHATNAVFAICENCGHVSEFADDNVLENIRACAAAGGFRMEQSTIELKGCCETCADG